MSSLYVFLAALALTAPLLVPLARVFFGTWTQFAEETGLRTSNERGDLQELWSRFTAHASDVLSAALLDMLGLFVAYVVVLGLAYHLLAWLLSFFGVTV
jgi:hypothetical protein